MCTLFFFNAVGMSPIPVGKVTEFRRWSMVKKKKIIKIVEERHQTNTVADACAVCGESGRQRVWNRHGDTALPAAWRKTPFFIYLIFFKVSVGQSRPTPSEATTFERCAATQTDLTGTRPHAIPQATSPLPRTIGRGNTVAMESECLHCPCD